jgi:hypothetical protein
VDGCTDLLIVPFVAEAHSQGGKPHDVAYHGECHSKGDIAGVFPGLGDGNSTDDVAVGWNVEWECRSESGRGGSGNGSGGRSDRDGSRRHIVHGCIWRRESSSGGRWN